MNPETLFGTDPRLPERPNVALHVLDILRQVISPIEGVAAVRVLPRDRRLGRDCHKVFVVLGTHSMERDARIVALMSQIEGIDYDLVPVESVGMIPDAASAI